MSTYEEKRAARVERLRDRAVSSLASAATIRSSTEALRGCMNGTPILVSHHSERRHRRDLEKLHAKDKKQFELVKGAEDLTRRANAAEKNETISSDDPDALEKLRAKLAEEIERSARVKADVSRARKATKGKPTAEWRAAMAGAGVSPRFIETVLLCGWVPSIAGNASASVKRIEQRIAELEARAIAPVVAPEQHGEVTIEESENRVRVRFPGKPSEAVRSALKSRGFRWSPSAGAWQRMASAGAWEAARSIVASSADALPVTA